MRIRSVLVMAATFVAAVVVVPGSVPATHDPIAGDPNVCSGYLGGYYASSTHHVQVPIVTNGVVVPIVDPGDGPFYLDVRDVLSEHYLSSLWLYQETNGEPGLQRGGRPLVPSLPCAGCYGDPCIERLHPDRPVY